MSSLEYLTSLTPKGVKIGQPGGRQKILKWEDVAAALGMGNLSKEAYLLGRAKYCHDAPASRGLIEIITDRASRLINERKWKSKRDLSCDLAKVACLEALTNQNCEYCHGTGIILDNLCEHCDGRGRARVPEASKYNMANMDKRNWQRRWRSRYEEIYQMLVNAEDELAHHLAVQLS